MPGLKKEGVCMNQDIQMKQISELRLDPDNPRLPEGADTSTQAAILKLSESSESCGSYTYLELR